MKKILALLIGLSAFLPMKAQDINTVNIIINYNRIRNELTNSNVELYEDTLISKVLSNKDLLIYLQDEFSKDSLRTILRKNEVYDYQIEFLKLEYDKDKVFDYEFILERQNELINILKDTAFNRVGICIEIENNILNTYLIFTKRYIEFDSEKLAIVSLGYDDVNIEEFTIQISGKSYVKNIQYSSVESVEKIIDEQNQYQVNLQKDDRFQITVDITPGTNGAKDKYLIITDNENNVLSINQFYK